jgi:chromosome segregation ATPase
VSEQREELAVVRRQLDALLVTAADAEDKMVAIEGRRTTIDAVHSKATLIANLLEDVRVNLETLGEQKAVVDHVAVKLARLDFMMQEAQNTLRALQQERELAERIEQNIAQLRARTSIGPDTKGVATT